MRSRQPGRRAGRGAGRSLSSRAVLAGCAVLAGLLAAGTAVVAPGPARASGPSPPSAGAVSAAAGQVSRRAAALARTRVQLATATARLASLQTQAEVVIERYDKTIVNMQRARAAYQAAQARLDRATQAEAASHRAVAALAAQEYEAGGGFGSMAAMLGNSGGLQSFVDGAAAEQQLAQQGDDVLSQNQASDIVAGVFRTQARRELAAEQAAARQAATLRTAVLAAIARQRAAVGAIQASTKRLEAELGAARAREYRLEQARQAAAARAAAPAAQVSSAGPGGYGFQAWPSSYSLAQGASARQGNIAANWALTQLGRPYQWGGAGPDSYDCSGLTMDAWAHAGVTLLHWTGYQWPSGPHIPLDQLRRGDLLFYATDNSDPATIHHVGIYIGGGEMVDAPYTGADVRIDSIYQPGVPIGATRPAG